jgi:DNA polymerase-3 subunit epsilon
MFEDEQGYMNLQIKRLEEEETPLTCFHFQQEGIDFLYTLADKNRLCKKLCHLDNASGCCFGTQLHCCDGACSGQEESEQYNKRVKEAIKAFQYRSPDFFILEQGRSKDEVAVVKIEKGKYQGFGFIEAADGFRYVELLNDCIKHFKDNRDVQSIIRGYLRRNKSARIVPIHS